jgi:hypothetical protein
MVMPFRVEEITFMRFIARKVFIMSQNSVGDGTVFGSGMNGGHGNGTSIWDPQGAVEGVEVPTIAPSIKDPFYRTSREEHIASTLPMPSVEAFSHDWEIDAKTGMPVRRRKLF